MLLFRAYLQKTHEGKTKTNKTTTLEWKVGYFKSMVSFIFQKYPCILHFQDSLISIQTRIWWVSCLVSSFTWARTRFNDSKNPAQVSFIDFSNKLSEKEVQGYPIKRLTAYCLTNHNRRYGGHSVSVDWGRKLFQRQHRVTTYNWTQRSHVDAMARNSLKYPEFPL